VRLFRSNVRKLVRRPATFVTFLLLIGLVLLIMLAVTAAAKQTTDAQSGLASRTFLTFPGAWALILSVVLGIGGLLAVTYGAAIAGSEWAWGTLKAAIARGESRWRYAVAGFAAVAVVTWVGMLLAYAAGIAAAIAGASVSGLSLSGLGDMSQLGEMPGLLARAGLALAMEAAIGFAIATIARSQLAGIGVGIGVYFAEGIASIFVPGIIKWFPFASASAMLSGASGAAATTGGALATGSNRLDPDFAVLVVAAWLVGALVVAAVWTERAEISG
jgi:ABC-type transport system involved in multi-copper enzyme maturation permease subunit